MIILFQILLGFTIFRFFIALLNLISRPIIKNQASNLNPGLSILIPARNEAKNILHLIEVILQISYPDFELIILDDESEDETFVIIKEYAEKDSRLKAVKGKPIEAGWLGKNWACHQLSQFATKPYLLYLDADINQIHPQLFSQALNEMETRKLSLLSIFPDQIMESMGEKAVVPIMHHLLLSFLPLWAILRIPFSSLSAANGQFMLFRRDDYEQFHWHERVKTSVIEDIAIMQEVKRNKKRGMTFVSNKMIRCRMYTNYRDTLKGFSKNILAIFGNSVIGLAIYLGFTILIWPLFVFYIPIFWLIGSCLLVICMRIVISLLANQSVGWNLILYPFQIINLILISIWSVYKKLTGSNEWKGRNVSLPL